MLLLLLVSMLAIVPALGAQGEPNRPFAHTTRESADSMQAAIQPAVVEAHRTYPDARRRFLNGLPPGNRFYVTTRLRDTAGRVEQVFVAVDSLRDSTIFGRVASPIGLVEGYREGQAHVMPERGILDWTILLPDGREEGNFVGKFLDAYHARRRAESVGQVPFRISSLDTQFAIVGEFEGVARVGADTIEVVISRAVVQLASGVSPSDTVSDIRVSAGLGMPLDDQGNWIVADSSEWLPVRKRLAGGERQALGPLRFRALRPTQAPLSSFWLLLALEGRTGSSARQPGTLFGTFAHGDPEMFAGFK